ncbi:hypothetical protein NL676_029131 [Syzygium grande]|nr:hypothetical protein NL676_029131 [Syzygium grande]
MRPRGTPVNARRAGSASEQRGRRASPSPSPTARERKRQGPATPRAKAPRRSSLLSPPPPPHQSRSRAPPSASSLARHRIPPPFLSLSLSLQLPPLLPLDPPEVPFLPASVRCGGAVLGARGRAFADRSLVVWEAQPRVPVKFPSPVLLARRRPFCFGLLNFFDHDFNRLIVEAEPSEVQFFCQGGRNS